MKLSSSLTFLYEWVIPALWLLGGIEQMQYAPRIPFTSEKWIIVILWGVGLIWVLIYSWPIKQVTIDGDYFVISNYFTSRRVPISDLAKVGESGLGRGRTIILYFEPPTPFGKRVRLITPSFSRSSDDEIAAFLRSLIDNRVQLTGAQSAGYGL
jgi:hypothetical protein